jgi:hypothetical protein
MNDSISRAAGSRRRLLIGGLFVLAVGLLVVWLIWPRQPRPLVLHTGTAHYVVTATVGSSRLGTTDIGIDLAGRGGGPVDRARVSVEAIMPLMGHAEQPVPAAFAGRGHYRAANVALTMTGPWQLQLSIDAPDGVDHVTVPLVVSG